MTSIHDKDGVVKLLERLERVCREVKGLPDFDKRTMAVQAGCLESDLDELEDLVTQAREVVGDLLDSDAITDLDIIDIERLNSMLEDAGKEWFVITRSEATELKNLVDSMLPEQ